MAKQKNKKVSKTNLPKKYLYLIRIIFGIIAGLSFYIYGKYYHGFTNLIANLKNATNIFQYVLVFFIIFLVLLIIYNLKYRKKNIVKVENINSEIKDQKYIADLKSIDSTNNGLRYLIIFVLFIFGILIICSLIEFILPLLIVYAILFVIYIIICKIVTISYQKKH